MRLSFLDAMLLIFLLASIQFAQGDAAVPAEGGWVGGDETGFDLNCIATPEEVRRGETVTMNVTLCNPGPEMMKNVFLEVDFDADVEPLAFSMMPSEGRVWKFEEIGARDCANLALVVRVPKPERSFIMSRSISGEGFVSLSEEYSTGEVPYEIRCDISAWAGGTNEPARNSTLIAVLGEAGAEVSVREMGSGNYSSDEEVRVDLGDKSIEVARNVSANHRPFNLSLGENWSANYTSTWFEMIAFRNELAGNFTNLSHWNATVLNHWSYTKLDENGTVLISGEGRRDTGPQDLDGSQEL
jgi:hypothetical protein